jgi:hypothetical protein
MHSATSGGFDSCAVVHHSTMSVQPLQLLKVTCVTSDSADVVVQGTPILVEELQHRQIVSSRSTTAASVYVKRAPPLLQPAQLLKITSSSCYRSDAIWQRAMLLCVKPLNF